MAFTNDESTGRTIVRRFTGQLEGVTDLERATIATQEKLDAEEEKAHDLRLQSYYEGPHGNGL